MAIDWEEFIRIVNGNSSFVLSSHMRPDCDALGSEIGMAEALRTLGKVVRILNSDPVPPHISFIDPQRQIHSLDVASDSLDMATVDVWIILDTSSWSQLGAVATLIRASTAQRVVIDHHVSSDDLGGAVFKDTQAEATGRLVLEAMDALQVAPSPSAATALFAAIATDTGWFRFNSVTDRTFTAASRLVAAGAEPSEIFRELYENHSLSRLRLQGRVLAGVRSEMTGRLMYSSVSKQDLNETAAEVTDTEDVINRLLSVGTAEVAVLFVEIGPQLVKVSVRSRGTLDASRLAEEFAGGGHKAAAGLRFVGTIAEAQTAVLDAVRKAMK